jgi:hypothetical protein
MALTNFTLTSFYPPPSIQFIENQRVNFSAISAPPHITLMAIDFEGKFYGFQLVINRFRLKFKIN